MSVKNVQKQQKSKKASDVHSLRHDDKPAQSVSSLSSHLGDLKIKKKKFTQDLEEAQRTIEYFEQRMKKYMGFKDQYSREQTKIAEGELQLWRSTAAQINTKLKTVLDRMREMFGTPDKSQKKKKNYALRKVEEPPSDNQ